MNTAIHLTHDLPRIDSTTSNDALITAVAQGDRTAVGILYTRHQDALRTAIVKELGKRYIDAADDVLHDVFLVLLCGTATAFQPARGQALPWLKGVARRTAIEHMKIGALARYDRGAS
jgi:DNA-directed RNA polymerase specialized sigma24 family protein